MQVDRIEGLVAVVVHRDDIDRLVPERVDVILLVGNRDGEAVAPLDLLCIPDLGGILARAIDINLDIDDGTEGIGRPDIEIRGLLVTRLHRIARDVEHGRRIDDTDIERPPVDTRRIYGVVTVNRAENGEIDAGAIVGPALRHGVLARDDAVAKDPFEPVNLVGVERQESHKVDGIADRHRNRVRDGIDREGHRRNGIRESFGILEGVIKGEYDGMVVPEPDVFHNGRFP